ncbi:MAG: hypothetical protein WD403_12095 [Pirellulales bacterium]
MDLENQPAPYLEWLLGTSTTIGALFYWLAAVLGLGLGALVVSFVLTAARYGPGRAGDIIFKVLVSALQDIVRISPRRVFALASLAVREAIRRRVIIAFLVFIVVLLFAGWFIEPGVANPAKLYISLVMTATTYLVLVMALLLSALSLPADIENRTIYTVVTKPVRPSELVVGRVLGFSAIGTVLLALMGVGSYVFVVRSLDHQHTLLAEDLQPLTASSQDASPGGKQGRIRSAHGHRHQVTLNEQGHALTETEQDHWHRVGMTGDGGYRVGPPEGHFHARVPIYGKLQFRNRDGNQAREGLNVGHERSYRSYVEGATPAAAIWRFSGIHPADYPNGVPIEMTIRVYRTYKGEIDKGILGSITLVNPRNPKLSSIFRTFLAKEYSIDQHVIPLKFQDDTGRSVDLFKDLVADGELEIQLKCLERAQFFGMAQPDLYLLPREGLFWVNYVKGYVSIWLQMVLLTTIGVVWSTFLNGPVALLASLATLIGGFFADFMQDLAANQVLGGGTFESLIRIVRQENLMLPLDSTLTNTAATWLDQVGRIPLFVVSRLLPNFPQMSDVDYVAHGFDIPLNLLGAHLTTGLGYLLPVLIIGMLCFKVREVAR